MVITRTLCLVALALITSAAVINVRSVPAKPKTKMPLLMFDCLEMPEVCTNMCYGVNCLRYDSAMYWDKKTYGKTDDAKTEGRLRGTEAGCVRSGGNRCNPKNSGITGQQCDEFPFKSVAPLSTPFNRCVPAGQNNKQGQRLKDFYHYLEDGLKKQESWFQIGFQNFKGLKYCDRSTGCKNDGNEMFKKDQPAKRDLAAVGQTDKHQYYLTKRGANLFIPNGAEIGDVVYSPRSVDSNDEMKVHVDEIVAHTNASSIEL